MSFGLIAIVLMDCVHIFCILKTSNTNQNEPLVALLGMHVLKQ